MSLFLCDQTVGCNECGRADWAEESTPDPTMWHANTCSLYRDYNKAAEWYDLSYLFDLAFEAAYIYEARWPEFLSANLETAGALAKLESELAALREGK